MTQKSLETSSFGAGCKAKKRAGFGRRCIVFPRDDFRTSPERLEPAWLLLASSGVYAVLLPKSRVTESHTDGCSGVTGNEFSHVSGDPGTGSALSQSHSSH